MTLLVGTRKGLFTLERGTRDSWKVANSEFLGEPVSAVLIDARTGWRYVNLGTGHFGQHLWRDQGDGWVEIPTPAYPPRPADATDVNAMTQEPWPWSLDLLWELAAGHPERPGQLWAGTIPGGLFRSDDGGDSWEIVRSLWDAPERQQWFGGGYDWPGIHTVSPHPDEPDTVLIAISCGGAWLTTDGGATWQATEGMRNAYMPPGEEYSPVVQDPHRVSRCAAVPDVVWNQHHNGCFRSVDGGRHWTEITVRPPSVFGFAVAAHPTDPDVAWFVPAVKDEARYPVDGKVVVSRTTDGGRSFDVLSSGLPGPDAYDLVYRHAFVVDDSGACLAMGSTTGSLWFSDDGGEHWTTVSSNLPPIAVVTFA